MNRIVVEAEPLLEGILHVLLVIRVVPDEHVGAVVDASLLAEGLDNFIWVIKQVVGIEHRDLDTALFVSVGGTIGGAVGLLGVLASQLGTNKTLRFQVVEQLHKLDVAGLAGQEVLEAGGLIQRRDGAAVVRRDATARVADQERPVVLLQDLQGYH